MLARLIAGLDERWLDTGVDPASADRAALRDRLNDIRQRLAPARLWRLAGRYVPVVPGLSALVVAWLLQSSDRRPAGAEVFAGVALFGLLGYHALWFAALVHPLGGRAALALVSGGKIDAGAGALVLTRRAALRWTERWTGLAGEDAEPLELAAGAACEIAPLRRPSGDLWASVLHFAGTTGSLSFVAVGVLAEEARLFLFIGIGSLVAYAIGLRSLRAVAQQRRQRSDRLLAEALTRLQ